MNEAEFIAAALRNPVNREIVSRLPGLGAPDVWLVSGSLFQSAWNAITGRDAAHGIKDYDVFYFDRDLSWEAEDAVIRRGSELFADLEEKIEIRNQGRVHLWYPEKFGAPYPPLENTRQAIDRFLMTCAQVGVTFCHGGIVAYAPSRFADIERMIIRPNRTPNFGADRYYEKAQRWQKIWPELTVIPP